MGMFLSEMDLRKSLNDRCAHCSERWVIKYVMVSGEISERKQLVDEVEELFLEGEHLDQDRFGVAGVGGDVV